MHEVLPEDLWVTALLDKIPSRTSSRLLPTLCIHFKLLPVSLQRLVHIHVSRCQRSAEPQHAP